LLNRRHLTLTALRFDDFRCSSLKQSLTLLGSPRFTWFRFYSYSPLSDSCIAPLIFHLSFRIAPPTKVLILPIIGSSNPNHITRMPHMFKCPRPNNPHTSINISQIQFSLPPCCCPICCSPRPFRLAVVRT
jgi:hypothetical protein